MPKVKNSRGFTLIELLVVLGILALISAIAIPQFQGVLTGAGEKKKAADLAIIQNAVELYNAEVGNYPATVDSTTLAKYVKQWPQTKSGTGGKPRTYSIDATSHVVTDTTTE